MVFKKGNKYGFKKGCIPWSKGKRLSNEHKMKISETRKKLIKEGKIIPPMLNIRLSNETKKKMSIKAKERLKDKTKHPMFGKHFSYESRQKMSKSHKECYKNGKIHGMLGKTHSINAKKLISKRAKRQYIEEGREAYIQRGIKGLLKQSKSKVSKAELKLRDYLIDKNLNFIHQYKYPLGIADFYLPNKNLIIQCYGDYWHSKRNYIKRDKVQNEWFKNNGYKVLILSSEKIMKGEIYGI